MSQTDANPADGHWEDAAAQAAIRRYFDRSKCNDPFMSMESLSLALSGRGQRWGTKECFDWCQRNGVWLEEYGLSFNPYSWGIGLAKR